MESHKIRQLQTRLSFSVHSGIRITILAPHRVAHTLFDRVRLGQVPYQSFVAVHVRGGPLGDDGEAVTQNKLVDRGRKYRSRYVDK